MVLVRWWVIKKVVHCIETHRFRNDNPPKTKEAMILFDADKLDKTTVGEIIRKSIIMHEKFKMNDLEIFERLMKIMNERKFHFDISKKIAEENKKPLFEAFKDYKEFLDFTDEISK